MTFFVDNGGVGVCVMNKNGITDYSQHPVILCRSL